MDKILDIENMSPARTYWRDAELREFIYNFLVNNFNVIRKTKNIIYLTPHIYFKLNKRSFYLKSGDLYSPDINYYSVHTLEIIDTLLIINGLVAIKLRNEDGTYYDTY